MESLRVRRYSGRKTRGLTRLVIRRVLDGCVGWVSGGREERSKESGVLIEELVEGLELKGDSCGEPILTA
jgi:hypothetical protein